MGTILNNSQREIRCSDGGKEQVDRLKQFIRRYSFLVAGVLVLLWPILQSMEEFDTVPTLDTPGKYAIFDIERIPRCQIYQVIAQDGKVYLLYEAKGLVNTTKERVAHL